MKTYEITNMDTGVKHHILADTAYRALKKMRYFLSLVDGTANDAEILVTPTGRCLYIEHKGETYSVVND